MRFSAWPNLSQRWDAFLDVCKHVEATGWDGLWVADHFMPNATDNSGPTGEAWTSLAAVAALVPRVRLGTLVTGNTYRHPPVLAKQAAQVDVISGGRLVFGIGSAWQENEHEAYGIDFYTPGQRLRRLRESLEIIRSLFTEECTTFEGRYYRVSNAPLAPKPVQQPHPPILIGGGGEKVTLRIAAEFADEWNTWGLPDHLARKMAVLDRHCEEIGRDPKSIKRSAQALVMISDDADAVRAARENAGARPFIAGSPAEVRDVMRQYQDAGVDEFIMPDFNLGGAASAMASYDRFINEVAPDLR